MDTEIFSWHFFEEENLFNSMWERDITELAKTGHGDGGE